MDDLLRILLRDLRKYFLKYDQKFKIKKWCFIILYKTLIHLPLSFKLKKTKDFLKNTKKKS